MPIGIVLCARRPFRLIGSSSAIELLPYVLEVRAARDRASLFAAGDDEPVAPAMQLDRTNPNLLRSVSGAPEAGPVAMLGCGSVGSKLAMHLARCGIEIPVLCDQNVLMPHNMARHALARSPLAGFKASELADELAHLGQSPQIHKSDLLADIATREGRQAVLPRRAAYAVNTKAQNAWLIRAALILHAIAFPYIAFEPVVLAQLAGADAIEKIKAALFPGSLSVAIIVLAKLILLGLVPAPLRDRLIHWRWRHPLPGSRAFTKLGPADARVDMAALEQSNGPLPDEPDDQDRLFYKIYRAHADDVGVLDAHKTYLAARDIGRHDKPDPVHSSAGIRLVGYRKCRTRGGTQCGTWRSASQT